MGSRPFEQDGAGALSVVAARDQGAHSAAIHSEGAAAPAGLFLDGLLGPERRKNALDRVPANASNSALSQ